MRVNPSHIQNSQASETSSTKRGEKISDKLKAQQGSTESSQVSNDSANASISAKAKQMAKAKQVAQDSPDVRDEKIAALKAKIANKQYSVNAEQVADKLVDDHLRLAGA